MHLEPIVSGNPSGPTILFLQGWPDDASLWDAAVDAVSPTYRCVRVNMPNYDGRITAPRGHHTEEIVEAIVELIQRFSDRGPITLVLHDWGSYWGTAAHHRCPELVARAATLDVAPHFKAGPLAAAGIAAYQSWLWSAFALGGRVGDWMTRRMAKLGGAPLQEDQIIAAMNYPYRNIWEDLFSGRAGKLTKGYWPRCPLLFVYGTKKPFPFHSERWIEHVRSVGGEVVALPSNHWVTRHPDFVPTLTRWLDRTGLKN